MDPPVTPVRLRMSCCRSLVAITTPSTSWITGVLSPKPPQRAKWRYCYRLTSAWTTSQHWLLKNAWKLNSEIKLNRKKKSLVANYTVVPWLPSSGVFITFPLLLTSSPPLSNHEFAPNSSSFPTILNTSHQFSLSHFGSCLVSLAQRAT